jgi:hypothetical protein
MASVGSIRPSSFLLPFRRQRFQEALDQESALTFRERLSRFENGVKLGGHDWTPLGFNL